MSKKRGEGGLTHVSSLLPGLGIDVPDAPPDVPAYQPKPVSKRRQNRDERITKVRTDRDDGKQDVGYLPKGFVLCGLPFKPVKNATYYERSNGDYVLSARIELCFADLFFSKLPHVEAVGLQPYLIRFTCSRLYTSIYSATALHPTLVKGPLHALSSNFKQHFDCLKLRRRTCI